uniref:Uncharacterized protein n=1 Tax=Panagrolaimus sp. JU765 TaxID=591449 RepID=A0AC34R910_9BILA
MSLFQTDAVAIQLVAVKTLGTFCLAYDLRNVNNKEMLKFPEFVETTNDCRLMFQALVNTYPPKLVKSIFLNFNASYEADDLPTMLKLIKNVGKEFGYLNINWVTDLAAFLTTELLMDKIQFKKYEVDDCITISMLGNYNGRIYLLRKQQIGWGILDCQRVFLADVTLENVCELFVKNGIQRHQIKVRPIAP